MKRILYTEKKNAVEINMRTNSHMPCLEWRTIVGQGDIISERLEDTVCGIRKGI